MSEHTLRQTYLEWKCLVEGSMTTTESPLFNSLEALQAYLQEHATEIRQAVLEGKNKNLRLWRYYGEVSPVRRESSGPEMIGGDPLWSTTAISVSADGEDELNILTTDTHQFFKDRGMLSDYFYNPGEWGADWV